MSRFATHLHQPNQRIRASDLQRANKLTQQAILDGVLLRLLIDFAANIGLAPGKSGYFPDSLATTYAGVDRSIGAQFTVAAGLGLKNMGPGQPDPDLPTFQPINAEVDLTVTAPPSDPANPRIDRIYAKPVLAQDNSSTVDVIDPATKTITQQSLPQDLAWKIEEGNGLVYVAGVPAATPSPPAAPSGYTDDDAIAEVLIQPGSGPVLATEITDLRTTFGIHQDMLPSVTSLDADQIIVNPTVLGQADAQAALESLEASLTVTEGLLLADWVYENTNGMKLRRRYKQKLQVEINGKLLESQTDIVFDLTQHLESGTEAPDTWYYCYLQDSGGTLLPRISTTPPNLDASVGPVGYHPAQPTWRFVGTMRNDANANILEVMTEHLGRSRRYYAPVDPLIVPTQRPGTAGTSTFVKEDLTGKVPANATGVLLRVGIQGSNHVISWSHVKAVGRDASQYGGFIVIGASAGGTDEGRNTEWIPLDPADQAVAFAVWPSAVNDNWYNVDGWQENI